MNKKRLFQIVTLLILIIVLFCFYISYTTNKKYVVNIELVDAVDNIKVDIYKAGSEDPIYNNLQLPTKVNLKNGFYNYKIDSDNYVDSIIDFKVNKGGLNLGVQPRLTENGIHNVLTNEKQSLTLAITDSTGIKFDESTDRMSDMSLYGSGLWASVNLVTSRYFADVYHVILHKENGQWVVKTKPEVVISKLDYSDIPNDVLSSVNSKQSSDSTQDPIQDDFTGDGAPPEEINAND